jgi:hypothetical protein
MLNLMGKILRLISRHTFWRKKQWCPGLLVSGNCRRIYCMSVMNVDNRHNLYYIHKYGTYYIMLMQYVQYIAWVLNRSVFPYCKKILRIKKNIGSSHADLIPRFRKLRKIYYAYKKVECEHAEAQYQCTVHIYVSMTYDTSTIHYIQCRVYVCTYIC